MICNGVSKDENEIVFLYLCSTFLPSLFSSYSGTKKKESMATNFRKRPLKVVTDSEDDQSDSRQRRDLHITSRRVSTIAEEGKEDKKKTNSQSYTEYCHTLPIHTITKASVLSKEAPPENYSGFLRLGSMYLILFFLV